jgi:hypothetical protein
MVDDVSSGLSLTTPPDIHWVVYICDVFQLPTPSWAFSFLSPFSFLLSNYISIFASPRAFLSYAIATSSIATTYQFSL